ncbi:hypothetical protein NDU88_006218 [Pleurodeles waltl]|uniref:Uncharacterized protein n=1 Tax=Pleurodeles waltl TaxID=8319 RepID=A0AAV7PL67_PLEWA|nr:hypothetical protein NDU88_006218 [Pleurodeles waltl]
MGPGGPARVPGTGRPDLIRRRGERKSDPGPREAVPGSKRLLPPSHRTQSDPSGPGFGRVASSWPEKSRPPGPQSSVSELRSTPDTKGGLLRS